MTNPSPTPFWDIANAYGYGTSEEIVGRAIRKYTRREDVVLATKVFFKMTDEEVRLLEAAYTPRTPTGFA
jgi:aryl-alcohol dehydrogenase-like predicted oxidoreductase